AARRQTVQRALQAMQILPRHDAAIRAGLVDRDTQRIEIGHRLDGDDLVAAHAVDEKIARHGEHERLDRLRRVLLRGFADERVDVLADVVGIVLVAQTATQELHQCWLQRQNFTDKPILQPGRAHARPGVRGFTAGIRRVCHPPEAIRLWSAKLTTTSGRTDGVDGSGDGTPKTIAAAGQILAWRAHVPDGGHGLSPFSGPEATLPGSFNPERSTGNRRRVRSAGAGDWRRRLRSSAEAGASAR